MKKNTVRCLLAAVLLLCILGGCAANGTPAPAASTAPTSAPSASQPAASAAPSAEPAPSAPAEQKPVNMRISWWGSDARHEATLLALDLYMEKNPHVKIEGEFQGWDGYEEKLATQVAGGTLPEIVQVTNTRMTELALKSNVFAPVTDYSNIIDISGFDSEFLKGHCTVNGVLMALPTGVNARSFFINKKLSDAAGVNLGSDFTWDEFITEGAKVNQHNPEQYMIICSSDDWFQLALVHYRQLVGRDMIDDNMNMDIDEAALEATYAMIRSMYDNKVVEPVETSYAYNSSQAENKKWLGGDIGCVYFTASSFAQFDNSNVEMKAYTPPIMKDAKITGIAATPSQVWAVAKNDNTEESYRVLQFMFNEDEGIEALRDTRSVPPVAHARELLASKNMLVPAIADAVSQALEKGGPVPAAIMQNTEIQRATYDIIDSLAYDTITPAQAVKNTIEQYSRILKSLQ